MKSMQIERINLASFSNDQHFYDKIELIVAIKNFDLAAIRKRYLASKKEKSGKTGSVERRAVSQGGLAKITIEKGKITNEEILVKLNEPRGIAVLDDIFSFSAENTIYIIKDDVQTLNDPWFSYIHTLDFDENGEKLIVSSSGFDVLFEYDVKSLKKTYEWWAWENGFNIGFDAKKDEAIILSRKALSDADKRVVVINDPANQVLPTAMRSAFINSVVYDRADNNKLLATFFHEGKVYAIDKKSGQAIPELEGLKTPHGGERLGEDVFATSTGSGEVVFQANNKKSIYSFKDLKGKPDFLADMEWLQNSKSIGDNIITIDSNRTSFVIFNRKTQQMDIIPYNSNWAIQDMVQVKLSEHQEDLIRSLNNPSN